MNCTKTDFNNRHESSSNYVAVSFKSWFPGAGGGEGGKARGKPFNSSRMFPQEKREEERRRTFEVNVKATKTRPSIFLKAGKRAILGNFESH